MDDKLESLTQTLNTTAKRNFSDPPLDRWHPELSGDIDIRIASDGRWYHEGAPIEREDIVRLFASILRREEDGEYYLLTPAEKWRIQVEAHALQVVDVDSEPGSDGQCLVVTLNTGKRVELLNENSLSLDPAVGDIAVVALRHGLTALFSRPAWYRLVDLADQDGNGLRIQAGERVYNLQV